MARTHTLTVMDFFILRMQIARGFFPVAVHFIIALAQFHGQEQIKCLLHYLITVVGLHTTKTV